MSEVVSLQKENVFYELLAKIPSMNIKDFVVLPNDTELEKWLIVVTMEICNELCKIYDIISDKCDGVLCPCMNIGHKYVCKLNFKKKKNQNCTAKEYILEFFDYVRYICKHEMNSLDGNDIQFIIYDICRRISFIFGHIYYTHLNIITTLKLDLRLNVCFKHYLYFIFEYELVNNMDLKPIKKLIQISLDNKINKKYNVSDTYSYILNDSKLNNELKINIPLDNDNDSTLSPLSNIDSTKSILTPTVSLTKQESVNSISSTNSLSNLWYKFNNNNNDNNNDYSTRNEGSTDSSNQTPRTRIYFTDNEYDEKQQFIDQETDEYVPGSSIQKNRKQSNDQRRDSISLDDDIKHESNIDITRSSTKYTHGSQRISLLSESSVSEKL